MGIGLGVNSDQFIDKEVTWWRLVTNSQRLIGITFSNDNNIKSCNSMMGLLIILRGGINLLGIILEGAVIVRVGRRLLAITI